MKKILTTPCRLHIFVLLSFLFMTSSGFSQGPFRGNILGRVVDEKGLPIAGVYVIFETSDEVRAKDCWADSDSVISDAGGGFLINEHCSVETRAGFLYMAPTKSFDYDQMPIYPPFLTELRRSGDPRFAGIPVKLKGNETVRLGDIPLPVEYNHVEVFVLDQNKKPYYKTENDWDDFVLIIRNEKGILAAGEGLSDWAISHSVRVDRGSVKYALPEGTWTLELLKSWDDLDQTGKTLRILAKTTVAVKKTDVCLQARLVVK
jgi:hypothetical protein